MATQNNFKVKTGIEMPSLDTFVTTDQTQIPSVQPSLNLDFTTKQLDPRITFNREDATACATYTDALGLIKTAPANVPRFDHDPVTGKCLGLLIEESRTNLSYPSRLPTTTTMTTHGIIQVNGSTQINANVVGVDGQSLAFSVTGANASTNSNGANNIRIYGITTATTYTASFWIKTASTPTTIYVRDTSSDTTSSYTTTSSWTRISKTSTTTGSSTVIVYSASGTQFHMDAIQIEIGAFPTSYIATTTAAVTRASDYAYMSETNFSSWFNQAEGTLYANGQQQYSAARFIFYQTISDGTSNNMFRQGTASGGSTTYPLLTYNNGNTVYSSNRSMNIGEEIKVVGGYKVNSYCGAVNGTVLPEVTTGTHPYMNRVYFGANYSGTYPICGTIKRIMYYPKRLSNAELQALSTL